MTQLRIILSSLEDNISGEGTSPLRTNFQVIETAGIKFCIRIRSNI